MTPDQRRAIRLSGFPRAVEPEAPVVPERYLTPEEQRESATVRHGVKREPAAFSSSAQADWDDRMRRRRR